MITGVEYIVYASKAGHTRRYAEMLSEEVGVPAVDIEESSGLGRVPVLFMGWISAGRLKGFSKASKMFDVEVVCMVSAAAGDDYFELLLKKNKSIAGIPAFMLQGGFEMDKVHGMDRFMMSIMRRFLLRSVPPAGQRTEDDEKKLLMYTEGLDCVDPENLRGVVEWFETGR